MSFYAVAKGRKVGIYSTWDECKLQVHGFQNAKFKKFQTKNEADDFIKANSADENTKPLPVADQKTRIPFVDFWPDDITDGKEDDLWLVSEAAQLEEAVLGAPSTSTKALTSITTRSATKNNKKNFTPDSLKDVLKKLRRKSVVYRPTGYRMFGNHSFPVDSEGYVLVYTDGACDKNGWHNAKAGLGVYFSDRHPLNLSKPVTGRATNNTGEIQAASEAIRLAKSCDIKKLRINTDSQFLINSVTVWMRSWKRNNWKLSNGEPIKNLKVFRSIYDQTCDGSIQVDWNYVKGHANIKGNVKADQLAKMGALSYQKPKKYFGCSEAFNLYS